MTTKSKTERAVCKAYSPSYIDFVPFIDASLWSIVTSSLPSSGILRFSVKLAARIAFRLVPPRERSRYTLSLSTVSGSPLTAERSGVRTTQLQYFVLLFTL